jgi:hypothetical protein
MSGTKQVLEWVVETGDGDLRVNGEVWPEVTRSSRIICQSPDGTMCLKYGTGMLSSLQSEIEAEKLQSIEPEDAKHFPRYIADGPGWIIVSWLDLDPNPFLKSNDVAILKALREKYHIGDSNAWEGPVWKIGANDSILKDGTPVVVDLGVHQK